MCSHSCSHRGAGAAARGEARVDRCGRRSARATDGSSAGELVATDQVVDGLAVEAEEGGGFLDGEDEGEGSVGGGGGAGGDLGGRVGVGEGGGAVGMVGGHGRLLTVDGGRRTAREGASRVEESGGLANRGVEKIPGGRKGEMLRNGSQGHSEGVLNGRGMVREGAHKDLSMRRVSGAPSTPTLHLASFARMRDERQRRCHRRDDRSTEEEVLVARRPALLVPPYR